MPNITPNKKEIREDLESLKNLPFNISAETVDFSIETHDGDSSYIICLIKLEDKHYLIGYTTDYWSCELKRDTPLFEISLSDYNKLDEKNYKTLIPELISKLDCVDDYISVHNFVDNTLKEAPLLNECFYKGTQIEDSNTLETVVLLLDAVDRGILE